MDSNLVNTELLTVAFDPVFEAKAREFASLHGLQAIAFKDVSAVSQSYALCFLDSGVSIYSLGKGAPGPVSASFLQGKHIHRLHYGGGKGQLIAKAVGVKSGFKPMVMDATAGLGQDGFVLASLGCSVQLVERSAVAYELLSFAITELKLQESAELSDIGSRLKLSLGDSIDALNEMKSGAIDVVYLDPMYPHRSKSALVKKEMKVFQDLIGVNEADDGDLLDSALKTAKYRVVVKRPIKGKCLADRVPQLKVSGKSVRYDVYTINKIPS